MEATIQTKQISATSSCGGSQDCGSPSCVYHVGMRNLPEQMPRKQWFKTSEFAKGVGMSTHAVNMWIRRNPKFAAKYCQNVSTNPSRVSWMILWEGVAVYIAQKNSKKSKHHTVLSLNEAKENVAEKANDAIRHQNSQLTPAQALLQSVQIMVGLEEKIQRVEKKLEETLELVTKPIPVTAGQRQFLNDRVKKYCIEHDLPYHIVWRQIHDHVGAIAVHKYELKHYQAAFKYLEKMYHETGLIW